MNKQTGFTLVELMIVLVIIAIIATIAIPNYNSYVVRAARGEGMSQLLEVMRAQEDYFASNYEYVTNLATLGYTTPLVTESGSYTITAAGCGGTLTLNECVRLTAAASNSQNGDGDFTLDSRGSRTYRGVTGWAN